MIRAHRRRRDTEVLPSAGPLDPGVDQHLRRPAGGIIRPEPVQQPPRTDQVIVEQGVPGQQRAHRPAGRAAQPGHLKPGELVRAQQPFQHTRREGGMAPAALTGDHHAPLPLPAITRCRHDQSPRPPSLRLGEPRLSGPAAFAPYPCPRSPGQEPQPVCQAGSRPWAAGKGRRAGVSRQDPQSGR